MHMINEQLAIQFILDIWMLGLCIYQFRNPYTHIFKKKQVTCASWSQLVGAYRPGWLLTEWGHDITLSIATPISTFFGGIGILELRTIT